MKPQTLLLPAVALLLISCGIESPTGNFTDSPAVSNEKYNAYADNPFVDALTTPTSTFSIDADGGSYANVRRFITSGQKPPRDAVRIEELLNYFPFDYPEPPEALPVGVNGEAAACPWNPQHRIIRIGLKGRRIPDAGLPASNFVLLVDVSGSMNQDNKLPLLKKVFPLLVNRLTARDRIAIVTYAGSNKLALPATAGSEKTAINKAIGQLDAGGGTAGAQGIITAYQMARQNFVPGGNNRVILATDGDFNIGPSSTKELTDLITEQRKSGIYMTVVGVGTGNYNDAGMEQLADRGNGIYEYIDTYEQGKKVFQDEYYKMYTVAKDVKVQVIFNTTYVKSYRLIGYENRRLDSAQFADDSADAGEIGSGQTVTALYEVELHAGYAGEQIPMFEIDYRYKTLTESASTQGTLRVVDYGSSFEQASESFRFGAAVAGFGMLLRDSPYKGTVTYNNIAAWASQTLSFDPGNLRRDFISMVGKVK